MTGERRIIAGEGTAGDPSPSTFPRVVTPSPLFLGMAPPAPTNMVLTSGFVDDDIFIDVDWTPAPPSGAGLITSYAFEILVDGESLPTVEHPPSDGMPPHRIGGLLPNTLYHISLRAITALGATSLSLRGDITTGHSTTVPAKITGLAGGVGFKTATITWTALGTTPAPFRGSYIVEVALDPAMTMLFHAPYNNGTSNIITITDLVTNTPYYITVHAISESGIVGPDSDVFGPLTPGLADAASQPSDGLVPTTTTAAPTILGGPGWLYVQWVKINNADLVTYEVHLGLTAGFTPSAGTKAGEVLEGTNFFAKQDGSGNPFVYNTNYFARIYPKDKDGYTSAGPSVASTAGQMVKVGASDVGTIHTDQLKDGSPPSSSPTAHVVGGIGFLQVWWAPVTNNDLVIYDVHLSTSTGFTPIPATLVTSTNDTSTILKTLPGVSTPLTYGATYFVRLVARDADGAAAPGVQASGIVLKVDAPDIVANSLTSASGVFGSIDASIITTGTLDATHIGAGSVDATKLSVTVGGQNFGRNTGFEKATDGQTPDSWVHESGGISSTEGWSIDATPGNYRYGVQAWKVSSVVGADYHSRQDWVLPPGRYVISAWVKRQSVTVGTGVGSGLNISGVGGFVTPVRNWLGTGSASVMTTGTNVFRQEWSIIDVGGSGDTVRLYLQQGYTGTATGSTWFDGVSVTAGDLVVPWSPPADEILPGTIVANMMTANSITAQNAAIADAAITNAKIASVDAGKITTGTLDASRVTVTNLSATALVAGTLGADIGYIGILDAGQITTGVLNATNSITVKNLNATEITTGTMNFGRLQGGTLGAYEIVLSNGGIIRSANFDGVNPTGWQIDGAGNLTANFATFRNGLVAGGRIEGSQIIGGSVLIPGKFYIDENLSRVECVANINIGANYSGGVYAMDASFNEDANWGMSIDHPDGSTYHTKLRYFGGGLPEERRAGVFDQAVGWAFFADQNTSCQARTNWGIFSSAEIKKDIATISGSALDMLRPVRPVEYRLKTDPDEVKRLGFIAEEVLLTSLSFLVNDLGLDSESRYSINYTDLIPVLTKAVGELETRINALEGAHG